MTNQEKDTLKQLLKNALQEYASGTNLIPKDPQENLSNLVFYGIAIGDVAGMPYEYFSLESQLLVTEVTSSP